MIKKLTLIGAGPGDPDLISVKGMKALQQAKVVLYDALVHTDLLNYAKNAECIYVGKRAGTHYHSQGEINQLILEKANEFGEVVRLKGGDPFIFGRGQEEVDFAAKHNIVVEVIPGITSAIGIPSLHQIPLTKRGTNESVWIVTGTTKKCQISEDIIIAAQSNATVVVLMGMSQLEEIVTIFKEKRGENHPIAIIQNGSFENEKYIKGTLDNIIQLKENNQITSPALIIIGKVVEHMQ